MLHLTWGACFLWVSSSKVMLHTGGKKRGFIQNWYWKLGLFCQKMLSIPWKISTGVAVCSLVCNLPQLWKRCRGRRGLREQGKCCFGASNGQAGSACLLCLQSWCQARKEAGGGGPFPLQGRQATPLRYSCFLHWHQSLGGMRLGLGRRKKLWGQKRDFAASFPRGLFFSHFNLSRAATAESSLLPFVFVVEVT